MSRASGSRRFWDWRLFFSLALLMAVTFTIYLTLTAQRDSATKTVRIRELVTQNAENTRQFTANQDHLLADQHELLVYTKTLAARQDAILAYLQRHGIHLPPVLLRPIPPPVLQAPSDDSSSQPGPKSPQQGASPKPKSSPTPKAPAPSSGPSASPRPLIPGIPGIPAPTIPLPPPLPTITVGPLAMVQDGSHDELIDPAATAG